MEQIAAERGAAGGRSHHEASETLFESDVVVQHGGRWDRNVHCLGSIDAVRGQRRDGQRQVGGVLARRAQPAARRELPAARAGEQTGRYPRGPRDMAEIVGPNEGARERFVRRVTRPARVERPLTAAQHELQRV